MARGEEAERAHRHRLQRAHLDEELAVDVDLEEAAVAFPQPARAAILGDDRQHGFGAGGDRARSVRRVRARVRGALHARAVAVPGDDAFAALLQALRHRHAHLAEPDQADHSFLLMS